MYILSSLFSQHFNIKNNVFAFIHLDTFPPSEHTSIWAMLWKSRERRVQKKRERNIFQPTYNQSTYNTDPTRQPHKHTDKHADKWNTHHDYSLAVPLYGQCKWPDLFQKCLLLHSKTTPNLIIFRVMCRVFMKKIFKNLKICHQPSSILIFSCSVTIYSCFNSICFVPRAFWSFILITIRIFNNCSLELKTPTLCVIVYCDAVNDQPCFNFSDEITKQSWILNHESIQLSSCHYFFPSHSWLSKLLNLIPDCHYYVHLFRTRLEKHWIHCQRV